jgi:glycosyltransferase involved in cell wall biosynthesis
VLHGKKIVVVLPAYRAEKTLVQTVAGIPREIVDEIVLVDDCSADATVVLASQLGLRTFVHQANLGYGANQKTCYAEALKLGADVVVMLHPDYQYDPRLVTAMAAMVVSGVYDLVLGSRILGSAPLRGGMPLYKYVANRALTMFQNLLLRARLSEYHSGFRAYTRRILEGLPLIANSDDYLFDNQVLTQAIAFGFQIGELSCPARYFQEASTISFRRAVVYGLGVVATSVVYRFWRWRLVRSNLFSPSPTFRLGACYYRQLADSVEPTLPENCPREDLLAQPTAGSPT